MIVPTAVAAPRHKPTPAQQRRALVTGVVLALTAIAIYLTVILEFVTR